VTSALRGEPLTIHGDGTQTRSFCYISDLVDGLLQMMDTPHAVTGPVNLGNPSEFTIAELADLVIELTGTTSPVEQLPLPADDPVRRRPDITLAKKILGWQPTVELEEGLLRTIDYFRSSDSTLMAPSVAAARLDY
jgi:UDP-glucuronate decarboxylase